MDQPEATQLLELSIGETLLIERTISFSGPRAGLGTAAVTDKKLEHLALKVGRVLLESTPEPARTRGLSVPFTEKDCWYLRETIDIFARVGRQEVGEGLSLKRKLYQALLSFDFERKTADLPQARLRLLKRQAGPTKEVVKRRLGELNAASSDPAMGPSLRTSDCSDPIGPDPEQDQS